MKNQIVFVFTLLILFSCEKKLTCDDFIEGEFITTSSAFPDVEWKTILTDSSQIDFDPKIPLDYNYKGISTDTSYYVIERIDKCSYRFFYDEVYSDFPEYLLKLNESGFLVEMNKIEGNCLYYTVTNEGNHIIDGKLCLIE